MQDAANEHREKLHKLNSVLQEIAAKPTVIDDDEFVFKLKAVQEKIDILTEDAKAGAGGGDRSLVERLDDLNGRLKNVGVMLDNFDTLQATAIDDIKEGGKNVTLAENTIDQARKELSVRF